jgi:hypothetical protein
MKRSIQLPKVARYKTPGEKEVIELIPLHGEHFSQRKQDVRPGDIEHMITTNMFGVNYRSSSIAFDESISKKATRTSAYGGTDRPVRAGDCTWLAESRGKMER